MLSSADWTLVRQWRVQGLPLRVVLRGIRDALDSHAHSWARARKVGSLRYCEAEVERARERWERALAGGGSETGDVAAALLGFAGALERLPEPGPATERQARALAVGLREQAGATRPRPRDVEPWLAEQEAALLSAIRSDMAPDDQAGIEAEVDVTLASYRGRMPERVLAQVRADGVAARLLGGCGLPRLSLFLL